MKEIETLKKGDTGQLISSRLNWEVLEEVDKSTVKIKLQGCGIINENILNLAVNSGLKIKSLTDFESTQPNYGEMPCGGIYLKAGDWIKNPEKYKVYFLLKPTKKYIDYALEDLITRCLNFI